MTSSRLFMVGLLIVVLCAWAVWSAPEPPDYMVGQPGVTTPVDVAERAALPCVGGLALIALALAGPQYSENANTVRRQWREEEEAKHRQRLRRYEADNHEDGE